MPLSRDRILSRALALADRNGLDSVSMRTLAVAVGVEAMSLYKHVASKDGLLDGVADLVLREIWTPTPTLSWRTAMRRRAVSCHEVLRHPWATALIESRHYQSDVRLAYANAVLGILIEAGFACANAYQGFITLDSFVYGFTLQDVNWADGAEEAQTSAKHMLLEKYPYLAQDLAQVMRKFADRPKSNSLSLRIGIRVWSRLAVGPS